MSTHEVEPSEPTSERNTPWQDASRARSPSSPEAAPGIGLATVQRFVEEGAKVVIGDIDDAARATSWSAELGGADVATFVHVDVTDKDEVDALFQTAKDTYGSVDIAFNNAGISPPDDDSILDTDLDAWRRVQEVNLTSVYLCCKAALPYMLEQGTGSIINTASFVAVMGAATSQISYSASKGGVLSMSPRARRAVRPRGRAGQRAVPRAGEHPAAAGAVRQGPRAGRPAAGARADGPVRRAGGDGQRRAVPGLRRVAASSPRTRSWSTAASPAPTSRRSEPGERPLIGLTTYREEAALGRVARSAPTCCRTPYADAVEAAGGVPVLLPPVDRRPAPRTPWSRGSTGW